jgi:hypothetical protein
MNILQSDDNSDDNTDLPKFEPSDAGSGVEGSGADANAGQQSEY